VASLHGGAATRKHSARGCRSRGHHACFAREAACHTKRSPGVTPCMHVRRVFTDRSRHNLVSWNAGLCRRPLRTRQHSIERLRSCPVSWAHARRRATVHRKSRRVAGARVINEHASGFAPAVVAEPSHTLRCWLTLVCLLPPGPRWPRHQGLAAPSHSAVPWKRYDAGLACFGTTTKVSACGEPSAHVRNRSGNQSVRDEVKLAIRSE
jgi:hypothetical protein